MVRRVAAQLDVGPVGAAAEPGLGQLERGRLGSLQAGLRYHVRGGHTKYPLIYLAALHDVVSVCCLGPGELVQQAVHLLDIPLHQHHVPRQLLPQLLRLGDPQVQLAVGQVPVVK